MSFYNKSATKDGELAIAHSRPATVYIWLAFGGFFTDNQNQSTFMTYYYSACDGVLINRMTILTAASCVPRTYTWFERSNGQNYTVNIAPNSFLHGWDSIYSVFIGLITPPRPGSDLSSTQQVYVKDIIIVRFNSYYFWLFKIL